MIDTSHDVPFTMSSDDDLRDRILLPMFPRTANFDPAWQLDNAMGTNPLWLAESLCSLMDLRPGMRVLDLGCGKGMSAIFLAQEFDLQVWAADLWTNPDENWDRIRSMDLEDRVFPLRGEALTLPFAKEFFDAIISVDAWHFFGDADDFLTAIGHYLKPGGQVGVISPGLQQEFPEGLPDHMVPFWQQEFWTFHSPDWWRGLWEESAGYTVTHADMMADGHMRWREWEEICRDAGYPYAPDDISLLQADGGEYLGIVRITAEKRS